jgi:hypothetical protein
MTSSASGAELALNYADGKLYYKNSSGVVTLLAGSGGGPAGGSNTQVQFNSSGALAGSANMTFNGTTLTVAGLSNTGNTILGDASADTVTVNGTITSNLIFTDNTYDIGASGATRPRNYYGSGTLTIGGNATVNGTALDINPASGNPNISLRTGSVYRGYIEGNSSGMILGAGPAATTILSLATTGASVTGTGSFTGDVTLGNAVAATNVNLNFNGVASKSKRIVFKSSGVEQWLIGQGAATEGTGFEIYNGTTGVLPIFINQTSSFVGINDATAPAWPLTVKRASSGTVATFIYDGTFAGTGEANLGLRFYNGGSASDTPQVLLRGYGTTNYTGNFAVSVMQGGTYPNTLIERFTVAGNTGNVGIGTTSPTQKLVVYEANTTVYSITETGSAGSYAIILARNPNNDLYLWNRGDNNTSLLVSTAWDLQIGTNAAKYVSFSTNSSERGRFDSAGTLILGDTSTASASGNSKLYIKSTLSFPLWVDTSAIAGSAFRAQTTGTTNNILIWNNGSYGYGTVGVSGSTSGSSGGDVYSLGYTNSAGGAANNAVGWTSSANVFLGGNTIAPTGVTSPFISKFDKMGAASTNAGLEYIKTIGDNTATTILTVANIDKWAGVIFISYVRDADQNRSGMLMSRYRYNRTFTTLLSDSQNSGATFSVSGNDIQVTIGGAGTYYCQIQIWGGAGA